MKPRKPSLEDESRTIACPHKGVTDSQMSPYLKTN